MKRGCRITPWLAVRFLLCLLPLRCLAQQAAPYIIKTSRLTIEDGLISNVALCGLQDHLGFIWIGTPEGLQRYDGSNFILINMETGRLQGSKISLMAEDRDGRLWLLYGSEEERLLPGGRAIDLLSAETREITPLQQAFGSALPFRPGDVKWLFADERHNLFLITGDNEVWWYKGKNVFKQLLSGRNKYSFFPHNSLYYASNGNIWLSADYSVVHLDTLGHARETFYEGWPDLNVLRVLPDGDCLAMGRSAAHGAFNTEPGFVRIHRDGTLTHTAFDPFPFSGHSKTTDYLLEYRADIRSRNVVIHNPRIGLQLLTDSNAILLIDTATLAQEAPLSPYAYFTDRGGGHWLCSSAGVFRFQVAPAHFTSYLTRQQLPAPTAVGNQARGIWTDGDSRYVARDGLFCIRDSGRHTRRLSTIHPILVQGDSTYIWFSSWFGETKGLFRMRRSTNAVEKISFANGEERELWGRYRLESGITYLGGSGFIGVLKDDQIVPLTSCDSSVLKGTCYQFAEEDHRLYAITDDGLYEISGDCYRRVPVHLPDKRFHHLYRDRSNTWWFCTNGGGLIRWDRKQGLVKQFTIRDGLPSNVLYALLEDRNGLFWISSNNGLFRFNPATLSVRTFTRQDGLPDNEFNRGSYFKAADGRLYFGGVNGIVSFDPATLPDIKGATFNAPLQLISLQGYNAAKGRMEDKMNDFLSARRLVLGPDDKFINLEVSLLDYLPGGHRYAYKLEGIDNDWIVSSGGAIRLSNLPYGDHILHIRGQAAAGAWSSEVLHIPLTVNAPFYKKPWFLAAAGLLLVLGVWAGIRARLQLLRRANRRLEEVVNKRTGELRESLAQKEVLMKEIHHRVKNNLQVISALQQMQSTRSKDPQVKAALEESQNRVLSIAFIHHNLYQHDELKGVEMRSFVDELTDHISAVFKLPGKTIHVQRKIDTLFLDIDTAVPVGLIINELLTNSYKYAFQDREEGTITIALEALPEASGCYVLTYSDSGPGLPEHTDLKKVKSLGLKLIHQLSRQLQGTLTYGTGASGTFHLLFYTFEIRNQH